MDQTVTRNLDRKIDLIDTAPRFSDTDAIRLNNLFRGTDSQEMLRSVIRDGLAGDLAVVSSFGAESAVLLHLVAQVDRTLPVLFLETHKHFPETISYRDQLVDVLGLTNLVIVEPDADLIAKKDDNGLRWSWDPDGCCEIRKVEPLAKALLHYDASITGRKGFQSKTRAGLPRFEIDRSDAQGRFKINPLASWSKDMLEAYFAENGLPAPPLGPLEGVGQDRMRHPFAHRRDAGRRAAAGLRSSLLITDQHERCPGGGVRSAGHILVFHDRQLGASQGFGTRRALARALQRVERKAAGHVITDGPV